MTELVGCILRHISPCWSFNAKSCSYIYIYIYIKFDMVSRQQTYFLANLRALNLTMAFLFLARKRFCCTEIAYFLEKMHFPHLFFVYMILTDGNISQSKIVETS